MYWRREGAAVQTWGWLQGRQSVSHRRKLIERAQWAGMVWLHLDDLQYTYVEAREKAGVRGWKNLTDYWHVAFSEYNYRNVGFAGNWEVKWSSLNIVTGHWLFTEISITTWLNSHNIDCVLSIWLFVVKHTDSHIPPGWASRRKCIAAGEYITKYFIQQQQHALFTKDNVRNIQCLIC